MTIGVDLDGILAYIIDPILKYHNDTYGTSYTVEDMVDYKLSVIWGCSHPEAISRVLDFYKSPYMDLTKPIEGSIDGISKLSKDHDLIIITSRPRSLDNKTRSWLDKYFPNKFKDIIHTNQVSHEGEDHETKSSVCLRLNAGILIEDHLDYAYDCIDKGVDVLLLDKTWNQENNLPIGVTRVHDWKEILENISKIENTKFK